jgi:acetyltransferase-like isoleucine patch superfamily enzyme
LWQKILGFNRAAPWPVSPFSSIGPPENIQFDPDDLNNFQGIGCYFQCFAARIVIGSGTYIAQNVGIITANHDPCDPHRHLLGKDVVIGRSCWIGMNAVILPGVRLGDHTVVGAGAVVSRSFPEGHCVLAGVPARLVRRFDDGTASPG